MKEIPEHKLIYQWGHNGTHVHPGIAGQSHTHGPGIQPVTFRTNHDRHHHHDERCDPPPIIRILAFMCGLTWYETITQIRYRDGERSAAWVGGRR